jgi:DNA-binding NarL/FixJ family response regulator
MAASPTDARGDDPIRVVLCDDHMIVREGLKRLIETTEDIVVAGEVASGEEAIEAVGTIHPNVVLMDIRLPGIDGVSATAAIRERYPTTRILALSTFVDDDLIFGALRAGAHGYLAKDVEPERLFDAIRSVAAGKSIISDEVVNRLVHRIVTGQPLDARPAGSSLERLTAQERVVLRLVAEGLTNQEIADSLCLSVKTVKSHLSNMFAKLDVHNRAQAVAAYLRWRDPRSELA